MKFYRTCSNCGQGMNEGYCAGNGEEYYCSDECLFTNGYTKEMFVEDYENDNIYWTEWEEE
jgi:hypothetical protein